MLSPEPERPGSELSARLNALLRALRGSKELWQECWVVRQGTPMEAHLMPYLVEDRQAAAGSLGYLDFMLQVGAWWRAGAGLIKWWRGVWGV